MKVFIELDRVIERKVSSIETFERENSIYWNIYKYNLCCMRRKYFSNDGGGNVIKKNLLLLDISEYNKRQWNETKQQ